MIPCTHTNELSPLGYFDHVQLRDDHHTSFILFRCRCGQLVGYPECNYFLAITEGTEETRRQLRELQDAYKGVDLRKEIELAARLTAQGRAAIRSVNNVRRLHRRLVKIANQISTLGRSHR